jgi:hypothetical protein
MSDDFATDIESDSLREAEMMQARTRLARLVGQSIVAARVEETRIALVTNGGTTYFFYGFMGEESGTA